LKYYVNCKETHSIFSDFLYENLKQG
jgi:hypothetical protein